jgi:hypothetical protein
MTLQEKVQLVKQRLGDPSPDVKSGSSTWTMLSSARLALYTTPYLLGLYFLYRINKNTRKAK